MRSDSALYQAAVVNHCFQRGDPFTITADQDSAVKAAIRQIPESEWQPYPGVPGEGRATDREMAETVPGLNKTKRAFRRIGVRWPNPQPSWFEADAYCYPAVISNRDEAESAREVLGRHNRRGESENWHQELPLEWGMEPMPCGPLQAHAVFLAMGVLAYNRSLVLQAQWLPAEYRRARVATLRWKLYRLAGQRVRPAGVWSLKIQAESEKLSQLIARRQKC